MALTDLAIRNAKPSVKPQKLSDGGNLYLLVTPAGGKLWRFNYRFIGKQKTLSLGAYPNVTLLMARERLLETKKLLASGRDPAVQAKLAKITRAVAAANTFNIVADEYLEKYASEGRADATVDKARWLIGLARPDTALGFADRIAKRSARLVSGCRIARLCGRRGGTNLNWLAGQPPGEPVFEPDWEVEGFIPPVWAH